MQDRFERTVDLPDDLRSPSTRDELRKQNRNVAFDMYLKTGTIPAAALKIAQHNMSTEMHNTTNRSFLADASMMSATAGQEPKDPLM
jgi:hypothetical protein